MTRPRSPTTRGAPSTCCSAEARAPACSARRADRTGRLGGRPGASGSLVERVDPLLLAWRGQRTLVRRRLGRVALRARRSPACAAVGVDLRRRRGATGAAAAWRVARGGTARTGSRGAVFAGGRRQLDHHRLRDRGRRRHGRGAGRGACVAGRGAGCAAGIARRALCGGTVAGRAAPSRRARSASSRARRARDSRGAAPRWRGRGCGPPPASSAMPPANEVRQNPMRALFDTTILSVAGASIDRRSGETREIRSVRG